jgi:DUF4097 and DUF4098 domain-containing protein YvlB
VFQPIKSKTLLFSTLAKAFFLGLAILVGLAGISVGAAQAASFSDTIERDFPLRSLGELRITNARGDITINGWSQDRVRLKAVRKVQAASQEEANRVFSYTDVRYKTVEKDIEVTAEYGRGLKIEERLKERNLPQVGMDLNILAPSSLPLRVWAVSGKVIIKGWNANLEVRSSHGAIEIELIRKGSVAVLCPSCTVRVKTVHSSLRCMGGTGNIEISEVTGSQIYVESDSGAVNVSRIEGDQLYVTKAGAIDGKQLKGRIEFHTRQGNVSILDSMGFISGRTETGTVSAQMREWSFLDKALIESVSGSVSLSVPASFSAEVDLRSGTGRVFSAFPLILPSGYQSLLQEKASRRPFSRLMGMVNDGGEQLKLASDTGNVSLLKLESSASR